MDVRPGARVLCEFGRKKVLGIVLDAQAEPQIEASRIKPLRALLDPEPVLGHELLTFLQQLASYYFAPIGEVLRLAVPAVERRRLQALEQQGELLPGTTLRARQVGGRLVSFVQPTDRIEEPGSLRGQAAAILALLRSTGEMQVAELAKRFGNARSALKKLDSLGLVRLDKKAVERRAFFGETPERDEPPELIDAQLEAVGAISAALEQGDPRSFLLFGVTGSGKTEVYMRAITQCLEAGRGALVLVPEIALTPQLVGRFRARFGNAVALLHSALPEPDRHAMWRQLREGEVRVAVGARSALFAPVEDLALVVVDEEHDSSFKQEEGVRYQARDMALLRAHRAGAVAVLGSATPSLESIALVQRGKITQLDLPVRARSEARLPKVETIDLKTVGAGPSGHRLITVPLHRALEQTLESGEQVIVFLNRRGFAPSVVCETCGHVATCKACSVALTYHRRRDQLRCHYCDYATSLGRCGECSGEVTLEGLGTEKLEQALTDAFPQARIGRLDRDVAAGVKSEKVLDKMRAGDIDILVGTQMVTKGHDLPKVTLVAVINADAALSMPDFRAAERGFQLLVQVAGRAGRAERSGRVLIQTRDPQHAAVRYAISHDVAGFLNQELQDRREVRYPPFARIALVRVDAMAEALARKAAGQLAAHARTRPEVASRAVEVLGPAAAPIARLRGRYRFRLFLRAQQRTDLRAVLAFIAALKGRFDRKVRIAIDVDPFSML